MGGEEEKGKAGVASETKLCPIPHSTRIVPFLIHFIYWGPHVRFCLKNKDEVY